MPQRTRREFIKSAAAAGAALLVGNQLLTAAEPASARAAPDKYITCFYQFNLDTLKALSAPGGLRNRPEFLHIFSASHAGHDAHPKLANAVRACGPSFKYARAIDIWKYKGWQQASDEQLRQWSIDFRAEALPSNGPADYFAFNEMPAGAESDPQLQRRIATWMRYLHDPNDGRPKLPAVFYLVEENLSPKDWKGDAINELWAAVDATSELVVGEHYHDTKFLQQHTPLQMAEHLFALAKWLDESGKPEQQNIARHKYAVLHSTYYGKKVTNWQGLQQNTATPQEYKQYLARLIEDTRRSAYGHSRIAFGPLDTVGIAPAEILPALTDLLHADASKFKA